MNELDEVPSIIERYTYALDTDLSTWELRCQAVASAIFTPEEAGAIATVALLLAYPAMDYSDRLFWRDHLPKLLQDAWGNTPLAGSARDALLSIGRLADQNRSDQ